MQPKQIQSGTVYNEDGVFTHDPMLAIPIGLHSDIDSVNKEGRSLNVDSGVDTDIWDLGTQPIWLAPTGARKHQIVSSNTGDVCGVSTLTLTGSVKDTNTVTIGTKVYTFEDVLTNTDGNVKISSAQATGILTLTGDAEDTETVLLGTRTYTFQDTLTNVDGNVKIASEKAVSALTLTADLQDGDKVVIGSKTYTFQNTLTDSDGNVHIGSEVGDGTLSLTADIQDTNTVTIGSKVYTFQNTLTDVDGNVHIASEVGDGTFTLAADIEDTETVTIGTKVYTFQNVLTDVDGNVHIASETAAGTLTFTARPLDGQTVTVGATGEIYTFQETLTDVDGNVLIGADASDSLDNLIAAINLAAGSGTTYAASMTLNANVSAVAGTGDTMVATAKVAGTDGNALVSTETIDTASWTGLTLSGGTDDASGTLDNFIAAINSASGAGTAYATSMAANTDVLAVAGTGDTMVVTALIAGTAGNALDTTSTAASGSFAAITLLNGTDDASGTLDNFIAAINGGAGSGTAFAASMVASTDVLAVAGALDTMDLTALIAGTAGNAIDTLSSVASGSFSALVLENGTDDSGTTISNFVAGVNGGAGSGTAYAAAMNTNTDVVAASGASVVNITAILNGTTANAVATTTTSGQASWTAGTMAGGTDDASGTLDNLIAAMALGAGKGTKYATLMTVHAAIESVAGTGVTMNATAKDAGTAGNSLDSTTTITAGSFAAATLAGGTDDESGTIDNLIAAINLASGGGTTYAAAMTNDTTVVAVAGAGDTMLVFDYDSGGIATTQTLAAGTWGTATAVAGVGAREIVIRGLTGWDSEEVSETIYMKGDVNYATVNSYVIIHAMEVVRKGATSVNIGIIKATADTDSTITAQIIASEGEARMAIYGVPSTQKAYMTKYYTVGIKAVTALAVELKLLMNPEPDVETTNYLVKGTLALASEGTSVPEREFKPYKEFAGPCIIKLQANADADDSDVAAGFDLILVDN